MHLMKTCLGLGELSQWNFGVPAEVYCLALKPGARLSAHVELNVEPLEMLGY